MGGAPTSSVSVTATNDSYTFVFDFSGTFPSSLRFRFNGASGDPGDTIELSNVRVNGQDITSDLTGTLLTQGAIFSFPTAASDHLFGRVEPTTADLGTPTGSATNQADVINATAGDDRVRGLGGDDAIDGGNGDDMIFGEAGNDLIIAGAGNDFVLGGSGDDLIYGQDDSDTLIGEDGNDVMNGGAGDDFLLGDAGNDILYGETGDDWLLGGDGDDRLFGDDGNDYLIGDAGDDIIMGGNDDDNISGDDGNDYLYGEAGNDTIAGGNDNDVLDGGAGVDEIYGEDGDDTLSGGTEDDYLSGGNGADILNGDAGADVLMGGAGADTLNGGDDNDILHGHSLDLATVSSVLYNNPGVIYSQETGSFYQFVNSSITWSAAQAAAVAATLNGAAGHLVTVTTAAENDVVYQFGVDNGASSSTGVGGNRIWLAGTDTVTDQVWRWSGGAEDGLQFSAGSASVHNFYENWGSGQPNNSGGAQVYATIWFNGGGDDDSWDDRNASDTHDYVIEWEAGSIADDNAIDTINGGNGNDQIYGWGGDDILNGDSGADMIFGGLGNDTINGGDDNDNLFGGNGDDVIDGGLGNDYMDGGAGSDTADYSAYGSGVTVNLSIATAQNTVAAGNDTLFSIENLAGSNSDDTLTGDANANILSGNGGDDTLNGGDGDDTINGDNGDDIIYGGLGADVMNGGNNNDSFYVSGNEPLGDTFNGDSGTDRVYMTADSYFNLATSFSSINSIETGGFDIIAQLNDGFDLTGQTVNGGGALRGQGGNETMTGTGSADIFYGGLGADVMNGGSGADIFYISGNESLGDTFKGDGGTDTVNLTADSYFNVATLFSSISSIETSGFNIIAQLNDGFDLTGQIINGGGELLGQAGNETITGSNSDDIMRGGDGNDVLNGGSGNDTLYGDAGADTLNGDNGVDTIYGGDGVDTIDGGTGNDIIYGGAGADILNGGSNNDDFYISGTDALGDQYDGGSGTDEIYLEADVYFNSANTFTSLERIINGGFIIYAALGDGYDLTGITMVDASDLRGQGGDEVITGSNSSDTIRGEDGNDTLNGGNGSDNIYGGAGADILNGDDGNDNFYISGTDSLGDQYDGGANSDEIILEADVYFNLFNTFTSIEDIESGGFIIYADVGTGFDLTGMSITGGSDLRGQGGDETITGSNSNDTIDGQDGNDILDGGSGADTIYGGNGVDTIYGGTGSDIIYGGAGADILYGDDGNDDFYISGTDSLGDQYFGGAGTDEIRLEADVYFNLSNAFIDIEDIESGGFIIYADTGTGFDLTGMTITGTRDLRGQGGDETITGSNNSDTISGFAGNDVLSGGNGADFIYGGDDNDILYGGDGRDELYGEAGADTFVLENATAFNDIERIRDFSTAESDALDISDLLSGYTAGVDDLTLFVQISNSGANSDVRVDVTGSGTFGAATRVATLYGITGLTDEVGLEASGSLITV